MRNTRRLPAVLRAPMARRQPLTQEEREARTLRALNRGARAHWWTRRGTQGSGFYYEDAHGARIQDEEALARIRSLAIPPGYKEVRVAPSARSRLQVIAVDAAGRLQYRYHPNFCQRRAAIKYARIERFGAALPALRRMTNEHLNQEGASKERVLAVMVRLINDLYFRVGTEESVRRYRTFGITTLRNHHLQIRPGGVLVFSFAGKSHVKQRRILVDEELASALAQIKSLKGSRLFAYQDASGKTHAVRPRDVNAYIKSATGPDFSAKDFRTWGGTLLAAVTLAEIGRPAAERQAKRNIAQAIRQVAERLGNTPTVCRSCYVHPLVINQYLQGITLADFRPKQLRAIQSHQPDYNPEELELLRLFASESSQMAA